MVVVNDVVEKDVKFIQDYNNILTKDKTKKQIVVEDRIKNTQLLLNSLLGKKNVHLFIGCFNFIEIIAINKNEFLL